MAKKIGDLTDQEFKKYYINLKKKWSNVLVPTVIVGSFISLTANIAGIFKKNYPNDNKNLLKGGAGAIINADTHVQAENENENTAFYEATKNLDTNILQETSAKISSNKVSKNK